MLRRSLKQQTVHRKRLVIDDNEVDALGELSWSSEESSDSSEHDDSSCSSVYSSSSSSFEETIDQEAPDDDSVGCDDSKSFTMFSPGHTPSRMRRRRINTGDFRRTNSITGLSGTTAKPSQTKPIRLADSMSELAALKAMVLGSDDEDDNCESVPSQETTPQDHLQRLLERGGVDFSPILAKTCGEFFVPTSQDNIKAYTLSKTVAIRKDDVQELRRMHIRGEKLDCCNPFGESILHTACRRGSVSCLRYLVEEVGLTLRIVDDHGRTVFHDAAWSARPNFEIAEILIQNCPKLLRVKDGRGFTPLQYVPRERWAAWRKFLDSQERDLVAVFSSA